MASLSVLWALFGAMWLRGETEILIQANHYNEFRLEFALLTFSMVFLPILLYELDQIATQ